MGKCPNCGHSALFLTRIPCWVCGKYACDKCSILLFDLKRNSRQYHGQLVDACYVCTEQCKETFVNKFMEQLAPKDVPIDESAAVGKIPSLVRQALMNPKNRDWLDKELFDKTDRKVRGDFYVEFYSARDSSSAESLLERLSNCIRLVVVKHLVTARRFEDAANLYERLGMYEEAGNIRAKSGEIRIKKTEFSVDLNSLLGQLKEGGIVVIYRCPHCGAKVKVSKETSIDSLKRCEHCGSKIETMDLAEFLRAALS